MISRTKLEEFAILSGIKLWDPIELKPDIELQQKTKKFINLVLEASNKAWDSKLVFWPNKIN